MTYLKANKAFIKVCSKYTHFANIFLPKLAIKLFKHKDINNYAIKLVDDCKSSYGLIYSLGLMALKTLKTYIENNLVNGFIKFAKSFIRASIFFDKKPNKSLRLYLNYCHLNNLIIKNQCLLLLVRKLLN